jgi:Tol biopolymer transport system component
MFRCASSLALGLALTGQALGQTVAQDDSAAKAAAKNKTLPLIATRSLRFTATEGTWISLDVSPDGRTILFELLGDLYTMPIAGGTATRITSGQAFDMQPRYSPDGKSIVFVSDRNGSENLWIADADGRNARALTTTERQDYLSPVWGPDSRYVIATKGSQLWLFYKDGGSGVQIPGATRPPAPGAPPQPPGAGPAYFGTAFGRDPRFLWLNVRGDVPRGFTAAIAPVDADLDADPYADPHRSTPRQVGPFQVGQLDRENGRILVRTHEGESALRPVPSPDGRWLVYATRFDAREALKLVDLTTGDERWLVMGVARDDREGGGTRDRDVYPGSAFTPDSRALITSYGGKIWRVEVPSGRATEIPFSAEVDQSLGPLVKFDYPINDSVFTVTQIRGARPSPDGKRVVFAALDRLWIADLPAGRGGPPAATSTPAIVRNARRLTTAAVIEHAPAWSPDGKDIAYVTWNDSLGGDIYRIRAEGGAPQRVTRTSAFYDKIAYTKDGTRILAIKGSRLHRTRSLEDFGTHDGASELEYVWLPAAGGEPTRITWVGAGATQEARNVPHVGPDPNRFYVWAGTEGLLSMRLDGTDLKTIAKVTGPPTPGGTGTPQPATPDEVVLSPDGTRALVRVNRNVYLIAVPPPSGDAPTLSVTATSAVPTSRLTKVGGDFVGWKNDGSVAYYSIGKSFFQHDIALADSLRADSATRARQREAGGAAPADTTRAKPSAVYEPFRVDVVITGQKDKPRGTVVLSGARIITMKGNEVIPSGDVVVTDNRIVAVGAKGSVAIPSGARVIDVSGKTILPGYVDIHAHTWVAWGVHRGQVSQFLAQLAFGVTTQRDPQTSSEDILTYTDLMEQGDLIGPRLYSTGPGIFSADNIASLDEARDVLRRYADHFNTQTIKQYLAGDRKVRQWVIIAARELGLTPTTEGGSNFTMNLTLMHDGYGGLEHSLPISPFFRDIVELEKTSGITYTPTLIVSYGGPWGRDYYLTRSNIDTIARLRYFTPHDELDKWQEVRFNRDDRYVFKLHAEQLKKLVEAGGRVGMGSHGEVQGIGAHWELWMLASGGMAPLDALRAATLHGADAIGLAKDIGSLEAGKLADLQVLDANPLDNLQNSTSIRYVMKNGRLYEASTLAEVWPRQRPLPSEWWWRLEPTMMPAAESGGAAKR